MKKILALIALVLLLGLNACSGKSSTSPEIDMDNIISLSYNKALKKESVVCTESNPALDIDFGCFFVSGSYYLIPDNNSPKELTDIEITSSNPAFEVSPNKIASLGAPDKSVSAQPIIRVGVNHKTPLSNMAESDLLPYGQNSTTLTLTGFVDGVQFSVSYTIGGFAYSSHIEDYAEDTLTATYGGKTWKMGCAYISDFPVDNLVHGNFAEIDQKIKDGKYCIAVSKLVGAPVYFNDEIVTDGIIMRSSSPFYSVVGKLELIAGFDDENGTIKYSVIDNVTVFESNNTNYWEEWIEVTGN